MINPLFITTPHSGTHVLCYSVGTLSQRHVSTPTRRIMTIPNAQDNKNDIHQTHRPAHRECSNVYNKLVLLTRTPVNLILRNITMSGDLTRECGGAACLAHYDSRSIIKEKLNNLKECLSTRERSENFALPTNKFEIEDFPELMSDYRLKVHLGHGDIRHQYLLLQFFDNWKGDKKIVFYNELMNNPKETFSELELFFEERWDIDNFVKNIESHHAYIHQYYNSHNNRENRKSMGQNSRKDGRYASMLNNNDKIELEKIYRNIHPYLYDKYLK